MLYSFHHHMCIFFCKMNAAQCKQAWSYLLLLLAIVTEVIPQCAPICERYYLTPLPSIDGGGTTSLAITANDSLLRLRNDTAMSLFASWEACAENKPMASCSLINVIHGGGGNLSADFSCSDLEVMWTQELVFVMEMESLHQNKSNCSILVDSFVFQPSPNVTDFMVERRSEQTCVLTLEGCFPPCCGSNGNIEHVNFGADFRYDPLPGIVPCSKISIGIPLGESVRIYDEQPPSSLEVQVGSKTRHIDLFIGVEMMDNLQKCFKTCTKTIDIGHQLTALNYTQGCFNVNVTISAPEELSEVNLPSYRPQFTYCKLIEKLSDLTIHIDCVGFNPKVADIRENIFVVISYSGVCIDDYNIMTGTPNTVLCMDKKCQNVAAFDLDFCLMLCTDNVATDNETIPLCEFIAKYALQDPLSGPNVTVVLEILRALVNSSSLRQIEAFNNIMEELLLKLQKQENLHLITETTGRSLMTILDHTLKSSTNGSFIKFGFAPVLLENIENAVKVVARGLKENILSSNLEYSGNNAIVLARVERIQNEEGHYVFPRADAEISDLKVEIPMDLLCDQQKHHNGIIKDCQAIVASVIIKHLPKYLVDLTSRGENVVNSLLLSTLIDTDVDYSDHILHNPITIYFTPTPLKSDFSNETCVFWDPRSRVWSSAGIYTSDTTGPTGETVCITTHLTSFAVLVDPESSESTAGQKALGIVSYIGCAISLACLLLSLLIFLIIGKALNKGVLLNIHINFVISLSLALALFVIGIETATEYAWVCTVIAAVLHYLFLCVFCWMLAEGIVLYMLVVRVFGSAAEKWYYLLLLGWGLPLPVVALSVGIRHEEYGTKNYCWLSNSKGTYWAFLGPMITIIMINSVILVVTVGSMIQSRRKFVGSKDSKNWRLALTTVKSTVILLPLLGLTWIIGPFSLLENTDVFSWAFAILNSLQGLFFFLLHVLRNDKVYENLKKCVRCIPASVMEKPWTLRELPSNMNLASAESVATATTSEGVSQSECEQVTSPSFSIRIYQRKSSEGSAISLGNTTVSVFKH